MENGKKRPFWVGIGASAGGLEALRDVVRNLEPTIGAIYVVLQHMSPQHKSLLTELIGRETSLDVVEITDGIAPQPDAIYISPPNSDVVISAGRLRLVEPSREPGAPKPSVDRFFQSLAETLGDRAIGIVLSGTGSDGALGVRAVRAAGGITIAQSEASAKYNGMPLAAVDTGCVDLVLSAEEVGVRFAQIVRMPRDLDGIATEQPVDSLTNLFQILQLRTGVDFREYKPSTVRRRIERRMTALSIGNLDTYAAHVREEPEEAKLLFRDMMISVTTFFRDPEEFEKLKLQLEPMVEENAQNGLRIWVPGCATGEEPYSMIMMIAEILGGIQALDQTQIQVFATDIDADALATARRGLYPKAVAKDVPEEFLDRYFTETDDGYQVSGALRERIVFTPHNLCQDPPFSNIDLISCRNLLIYFNNSLQLKVFSRLHYALKGSGLMFLGKSESISGSEALFKPTTDGGQVFRRRVHPNSNAATPSHELGIGRAAYNRVPARAPERSAVDAFGSMFHALVRAIGPDGMLVTSDLHIHRVYGNIDRFLSLSEGQLRGATINMLRTDLRHELRTLITLALRNGTTRKGLARRVSEKGDTRVQTLVHPIGATDTADDMVLVVFREWEEERARVPELSVTDAVARDRILELEVELQGTRESLQQTVEELETANEELQSLNEELQSANEELQSTNEELETTNEELQSTNEELITVNEEMQINSHQMAAINQELDSVLSNIAAPVLVVDTRLHIVQCSQSAQQMFQIAAGVARPHLSQLSLPGEFPPLSAMMAEVIQTGQKSEQEIDITGFRGTVSAAPYFNPKGELIGATAIVQEQSDPRAEALEGLLNNLPVMIWQRDADGKILDANLAAARFMGVGPTEVRGMNLDEITSRLPEAFVATANSVGGNISPGRKNNGNGAATRKQALPFDGSVAADALFVIATDKEAAPVDIRADSDELCEWALSSDPEQVVLSADAARLLGRGFKETTLGRAQFIRLFHSDDTAAVEYGLDTVLDQAIPFTVLARPNAGNPGDRVLVRGRAKRAEDGTILGIEGEVNQARNRVAGTG